MGSDTLLVGRGRELEQLDGWLDETTRGEPRLVVVEGGAGVGKTHLIGGWLDRVSEHRPEVVLLTSACHEDRQTPYLPVTRALAPLGAVDRMLDRVPEAQALEQGAQRRHRLHAGASELVVARADASPVVLVLDDVHWADAATLDLVDHLLRVVSDAAGTRRARVLVLAAKRPTPSAGALDEWARAWRALPWHRSLTVDGLDRFALAELVVDVTRAQPSRRLLERLEAATGGNPLVVRSLLGRLAGFGMLIEIDGELVDRTGGEMLAHPQELDVLLGHQLEGLSPAGERLATLAAFVGTGQAVADLAAMSGLDASRFAPVAEELAVAGIDVRGDAIAFDHPQLRQVLAQRPRGRRRAELHLAVADGLEAAAPEDVETARAIAIAGHLRRAGDLVEPARLARQAALAASRAASDAAWSAAAESYEDALDADASDAGRGASAFRALLCSRAAYAHWYNHDNPRAMGRAREAVANAAALGDLALWAAGLDTLGRAMWSGSAAAFGDAPDRSEFEAFLAAANGREPTLEAMVHWVIANLCFNALDLDGAEAHVNAARELVGDRAAPHVLGQIEFTAGNVHQMRVELDAAEAAYQRSLDHAVAAGADLYRANALRGLVSVRLNRGDLDGAERGAAEAIALDRAIGAWAELVLATVTALGVAIARGDVAAATAHAATATRTLRWARYPTGAPIVYPMVVELRLRAGDVDGAYAAIDEWATVTQRGIARFRTLVDAVAGVPPDVMSPTRPAPDPPLVFDVPRLAAAVELADATGDGERAAWAAPALADLVHRGLRYELAWCIPALAGRAALLCGQPDEARRLLVDARALASSAGAAAHLVEIERDLSRLGR